MSSKDLSTTTIVEPPLPSDASLPPGQEIPIQQTSSGPTIIIPTNQNGGLMGTPDIVLEPSPVKFIASPSRIKLSGTVKGDAALKKHDNSKPAPTTNPALEAPKSNIIPRDQLPGYRVVKTWFGTGEEWDPLPRDFHGIIGPSLINQPKATTQTAPAGRHPAASHATSKPNPDIAEIIKNSHHHIRHATAKLDKKIIPQLELAEKILTSAANSKISKHEIAAACRNAAQIIDHAGIRIQDHDHGVEKNFDRHKLADAAKEIDALAKALKANNTKEIKNHSEALSHHMYQVVRNTAGLEKAALQH